MQQDEEVISKWSESAPYWEKHRTIIREMFAPVTEALAEAAAITSNCAVLDIAMGPGEPALTLAGLVGPKGTVVGTDAVPGMVEAARQEARRQDLSNASFEVALAESLPFPDNSFDAIVCRFGVMFFPSPVDSIREMLKVLKPGGRIALAVWHFAERNPFHYTVSQIVERYVDSPPPAPGAPDAFRFAKPGELLNIVGSAGAIATWEKLLRFTIQASVSAEDFWAIRSEMSESLRSRLARLAPTQLADVRREVVEAIRAYSSEGRICFPAEVLIVKGGKDELRSGKT